jgi:hypothetical protein
MSFYSGNLGVQFLQSDTNSSLINLYLLFFYDEHTSVERKKFYYMYTFIFFFWRLASNESLCKPVFRISREE